MTITDVASLIALDNPDVKVKVLEDIPERGAVSAEFWEYPKITLWVSKEKGCPWSVLITIGEAGRHVALIVIDDPHAFAIAVQRAADAVGLLARHGVSHGA